MYIVVTSILVLILGEKEEVFAQGAGKLGHFFAAMVVGAGSITFSVFDTPVDLDTEREED